MRILIAIALMLGVTTAYAGPKQPTVGQTIKVTGTILCDEAGHLGAILEAQKESWNAGYNQYQHFASILNAVNDPTCYSFDQPLALSVVLGDTVAVHEKVYKMDGSTTTVYIVAVLRPYSSTDWHPGFILTSFDPSAKDDTPA